MAGSEYSDAFTNRLILWIEDHREQAELIVLRATDLDSAVSGLQAWARQEIAPPEFQEATAEIVGQLRWDMIELGLDLTNWAKVAAHIRDGGVGETW